VGGAANFQELGRTPAFYFDSITQLRLDSWSQGRIALAGDAGYCPGPAVGGSTSLAIVGAYVLAGELADANGDHVRAFAAYEQALGDYVRRSRTFAINMAKRLIPDSRFQLWAMAYGAWLLSRAPVPIARAVAKLGSEGIKLHDSFAPRAYAWERASVGTSGHVHRTM
jgi:2-polyprenyl-6-methoxyphenol hydroxylase-like FAD-dependent oxidoreductase